MIYLLLIPTAIFFVFIIIFILDAFRLTHIFMKKRGSGAIGNALRAFHHVLDSNAKQADEYITNKTEERQKSQFQIGENKDNVP